MNKVVPFEGPTNAKIYLVGEAPGITEEAYGRPFVGGAGKLLDRLLMERGLIRDECRLGNVMRVRPAGNNFTHFYLDKSRRTPSDELERGIAYLVADIISCNPNIVVAMGNEPLRALMGESGINNWRGSVLWCKKTGCKLIPTIHPASLLRAWDNLPLVLFDFKKVNAESKSPDLHASTRNFVLRPRFGEVMRELDRLKKVERVSFDVETDEDNHITALALADNPWWAISIPFTVGEGQPYWTDVEEEAIWKRIKELMENPKLGKIAQNAQFDMIMELINPWHTNVKGLVLDTMCGHHTIYPEIAASESSLTGKSRIGGGKSLAILSSIYTTQPFYKHWAKSGNDMQFWKYNAMDAAVTFEAAVEIEKEMKEFGVFDFYHGYVHPLIPILLKMQVRGVLIDEKVRSEAYEEYAKETVSLQATLDGAVGHGVNVNSPKQLQKLLYKNLGLPTKYKRGTTRVTTDERALTELAAKYQSPVFDLILKIRHNRKLMGTYLVDKGGKDGRMRCSYVIGGTETGRLSSRESVFGTGTNLQNIPEGVCRRMFIPDPGNIFIQADLSQAEARVVAYLSEEERLIDLFNSGGDVHTQNAAWIFCTDLEKVSTEQRNLAKRLVHASNYGIGAHAFAHHARIAKAEAQVLLTKYFDTFPKIKSWQFRIQSALGKSRTMRTPLGRKRTFFGRWGDTLFREAYAFVPQSTVGDLLNKAMIRLHEQYPEVELMLQIHDAYVIQCPYREVDVWVDRIKESFNVPINIKGRELKIPIDIKVGGNWDEMEKVK